ncbi:MAG: response regulator, partial [Burkholderiales bacterium]|nr:response regulator [Burkholderiales bacterium]
CMTVDITERTRTEEWLRLLEHCVARLNDVVFITEPMPNWEHWPTIIFVNDAFERQTGYSRAEAVGKTSEILRGPNTNNAELQRLGRAMHEWQPIRSELINYHKNGTEIWMELELVPIADAKGQYQYWVTVARNVNERKQAEQALRASEAMHRAIIDHAPLPMLVSDMETNRVVYSNQRCKIMFAATDERTVSRFANDYFIDEAEGLALAAKVRQQGFVNDVEVMLKDCANRPFWAMVSMVQSRYEGRDSIISSMVDISAIKTIQEQLRESREKADSANNAKSAFLSNMSHEIRTPLNSILGMTYLALATTLDAKQRDYLEKIHLSGQHLLALIDDILDFSKIEAGMFSIENIPFNLHEVINKLQDLMAQRIRAKGLQFALQLGDGVAADYAGDPLRLSQILINLTGNALKFTNQGQITVAVNKVNAPANDTPRVTHLRFSVQDTGIGLNAEQLALLFKPFQQADISSSRKYGGTGLGLAISRQLVELMHGEIGVHSEPGVGSTFWFTLPLQRHVQALAQVAPTPAVPIAELIAHARQKLAGCSVLLAEDAPLNQQVAMELLSSVGVEVTIANDGHEALAWLQQRKFDCVLMDVQMPGMDGLEATRAIRANPALSDNIIIAMTANASAQDRSQCLACGMEDFITKPIKPALLYTTLSKWMEAPNSGEQSLASAPLAEQTSAPLNQFAPEAGTEDSGTIEAIDLTPLTDLIGHDPALVKKFVWMFFDSADAQMEQIGTALNQDNRPDAARLLHGLRSEACAMGARSKSN